MAESAEYRLDQIFPTPDFIEFADFCSQLSSTDDNYPRCLFEDYGDDLKRFYDLAETALRASAPMLNNSPVHRQPAGYIATRYHSEIAVFESGSRFERHRFKPDIRINGYFRGIQAGYAPLTDDQDASTRLGGLLFWHGLNVHIPLGILTPAIQTKFYGYVPN